MKAILAAIAAFFVSAAHAETYMVMQYNENVRIVLSAKPCGDKGAGYVAVAQRIDRQFIRGCWTHEPDKKLVRIQWAKDDFSVFDADRFKPVTDGEDKKPNKDTL